MTSYTLLCACGHTVKASLPPAEDLQEGRHVSVRLRSSCPDCVREDIRKKQLDTLVETHNYSSSEHAFPSGSAWQIAWARDIRIQSTERFLSFIERFPSDTRQTLQSTVIELMNQQIKAGWWIENQNNILGALAMQCKEPLEAAILDMIRIQMRTTTRYATNNHHMR